MSFHSTLPLTLSSTVMDHENWLAYGFVGGSALLGASLPAALALGAGALMAPKLFKKIVGGGDHLRPAVFLSSESDSEKIPGGIHSLTVPPVLECIKKIDSPRARMVEKALKDILFYVQHFDYTGLSNGMLSAQCKEAIKQLKTGEVFAMPCSFFSITGGGHLMIAVFERQDDRFAVTIHNSESSNHYEKTAHGKRLRQTGLQIENVKLEDLNNFVDGLIKQHRIGTGSPEEKLDAFYKLIKELNGTFPTPSGDERLWRKKQTGFSCSGYSVDCLVRSLLSKEEYKEFKTRFMSQMVKKLSEGVKSGYFWEKTEDHQYILKKLKLKLQNSPKEWIDPGVLEALNKKDDVELSSLGRLSEKWEKRFWKMLFGGDDSIDPAILFALLQPNLSNIADNIDRNSRTLFPITVSKHLASYSSKIKKLYKKMMRSEVLTPVERQQLEIAFKDFEKYKHSKQEDLKYLPNLVKKIHHLHKVMLPYFKKRIFTKSLSHAFQALNLIKQKKIKEAKEALKLAYKAVQEDVDSRGFAEARIVLDALNETLSSHHPESPEELECFAVVELVLETFCSKAHEQVFSLQSRILPEPQSDWKPYVMTCLLNLFRWGFDDVIKGQPWEEEMRAVYTQETVALAAVKQASVQMPEYLQQ